MGEKKNSSCDGESGRTEEMKAVRSRLMWETCLPPTVMVMSRPSQLTRAISGSVVLPQLGSMLPPRPQECPVSRLPPMAM